jgi:D-alanine-D-alanine ligase-like ATP-grasp enzyme
MLVDTRQSGEGLTSYLSYLPSMFSKPQQKVKDCILEVQTCQGSWLAESETQKALIAGVTDGGVTVMPTVPLSGRYVMVFLFLDSRQDGASTLHGILEMEGFPQYLGGRIMATVLTRDKIVEKQVFVTHGISMVRHLTFTELERNL